MRPITLEPLARRQIQELPATEADEVATALLSLASADDPTLEVDPYMPGGVGPIPYHGVLLTARVEAVVTLYVDHVRVVAVRPRT
ncbi:hypothetical protein F4561_005591 [Lipingzhangella halophila]|uniref:mRNA-degrading endonuclease RelE of RelBE toxin-antitoxin system n=1 Tax=Lipingzhangella halophila TaxID=1783352 RepID=A0A7W7RMG7_9ACTN|nr:hypothetical protein [Lipingzhangella halophila]MBB4929206.1 hypothetical protein [Lipingzhangella halophila]MBB4934697.1 hypothetical protein [Lipingzhangella halophila]